MLDEGASTNTTLIYILVSAAVLAVAIASFAFIANIRRSESRLTRLAGLALALVLAGLFFGSTKLIGYSLVGVGVTLAPADMFFKARRA